MTISNIRHRLHSLLSFTKNSCFWYLTLDLVVLFLLNACEIILELVAGRLLSPYFGTYNFVLTAIIGIILLSSSLGNLIGGFIASHVSSRRIAATFILIANLYLALIPIISDDILAFVQRTQLGRQWSAVVCTFIFFLLPTTAFSTVTPIIMKKHLQHSSDKGKTSGRLTATISIGSLVGTFIGGFYLIPRLGTNMIFIMVAICSTILVRLFLLPTLRHRRQCFIANTTILFVLTIIILLAYHIYHHPTDSISIDTEYDRVIIENDTYGGLPIRRYRQSRAYASATFVDDNLKYELVSSYLKKYDDMFAFIDAKKVLMIGGAAYQYPKYFIAHFPDRYLEVVEIDPMATAIAREYFYLDDLFHDYSLDATGRLKIYHEDGRIFLSQTDTRYDAILNDAFSGQKPVPTLATLQAAQLIHQHLTPQGVYMLNVFGFLTGKDSFLRSQIKTLQQVFTYVYVLYNTGNNQYMVIATDNNTYQPPDAISYTLQDSDLILIDDYVPIDQY